MRNGFNNIQMAAWIEKLEDNVEGFINKADWSPDNILKFVRNQYVLVNATKNVMDGKAVLIGASFSQINKAKKTQSTTGVDL